MLKNKFSYYISDVILVIFEGNKNYILPRENIPFRRDKYSFQTRKKILSKVISAP